MRSDPRRPVVVSVGAVRAEQKKFLQKFVRTFRVELGGQGGGEFAVGNERRLRGPAVDLRLLSGGGDVGGTCGSRGAAMV